jgi:hypothetical protein
MGGFGLTIGINADPSQAQAAIQGLQGQVQSSLSAMQGAASTASAGVEELNESVGRLGNAKIPEEFNESILNAHQSTHLLAEELGIHLPRAVVSGISEIVPQIQNLGNILLGVFAVHGTIELIKKFGEIQDEIYGVKEAAEQMKEAFESNRHAIIDLAKTSSAAAHQQLLEINERIAAQYREVQTLEAAEDAAVAFEGVFGSIETRLTEWIGLQKSSAEASKYLAEQEKLRDELLKVLTEDNKKAAEAEERHAKEVERASEALVKDHQHLLDEIAAFHAHVPAIQTATTAVDAFIARMTAVDNTIKPVHFDLHQANLELQQMNVLTKVAAPLVTDLGVRMQTFNLGVTNMNADLRTLLQNLGQWNVITQQVTEAQKLEAAAVDLLRGKYAQEITGIVEMIAGKRAAAAVLAVWNAARAAEAFPDFEAMAQYTLASIKYALVAGGVGGVAGGSGARGGGRGGGQTGSPGVSPGALAPGSAPAPGGQLTVMVMGEPTAAAWLATNVLNPYVQRGGTLNASTAQRVPASGG